MPLWIRVIIRHSGKGSLVGLKVEVYKASAETRTLIPKNLAINDHPKLTRTISWTNRGN
jgi:hypothetical protein